jgi:hypothetical protein
MQAASKPRVMISATCRHRPFSLYFSSVVLVALGVVLALLVAPSRASAAPTCNDLHVRLSFYSFSHALSYYTRPAPDGCYESRRLLDDKTHAYTICQFKNGAFAEDHPYHTYLAFDDTQNVTDTSDVQAYQNAIEVLCPQYARPSTTTISLEYMAPVPHSCTSHPTWCWGFYYGQGVVNVANFYQETYASQTDVADLLSAWNLGTYNANPSSSAGTINISPFVDDTPGENNLFAKWNTLQTDVYDLCRRTDIGYLSIYYSKVAAQGYIYHDVTESLTNGQGTNSAEQVIVTALNACV